MPKTIGYGALCLLLLLGAALPAAAKKYTPHFMPAADSAAPGALPFPIHDRRSDALSAGGKQTFDLKQPANITDSIAYDYNTNTYTLYEKIGNKYYRTPVTYTAEEYWAMRNKQAEDDYFKKRANTLNLLNRKFTKPKFSLYENLFNRLFGNGKIDINPQGNVDIMAGYQGQNIKNPTLPERARRNGGFDFNMNAQVNVNASIGDKLKFPINYNTLANFGMENQLKLDYTGMDDEIIKRIEAGQVQFPSRSNFIPGAQQLFGLKTQLQFGKLNVTAVLANQRSQRQSVNLQGGVAAQTIDIKADEYEENRHFLLGQYFKNNYNRVLSRIPAVTAPVQILRLEVWVTNRNGSTTNTRDVIGLMDLGERDAFRGFPSTTNPNPQAPFIINTLSNDELPSNNTNDLYAQIINRPGSREPSQSVTILQNLGLLPVQDFEKTFARKLDSTQYVFNRQAGYISVSQPLMPDEVLAVAYQYTYNGRVYQVGDFSQDVPPDSTQATQKILYLKLLKATSQRVRLPIWQLMMKNVYSVGYGTLTPTDFKLNILYQEPGQGWKRYVPFGNKNQGQPIISLVNLDRLNNQLDPQPDGVFDYVEGYTVISQYSRVVFPVLEPFGRDLATQIYDVIPEAARDTLYYALYDSIKAIAQQYPNLNRFVMKGSARTSGSSDISIGYNIPQGSVSVTAGGQILTEGVDYDINYDLGTIKITNQAILNAGLPVQVNFENNASFGLQQRNYLGLRLDYMAKNSLKEQLAIGGTAVRLGERPFFTKNNLGEEPIRNSMYGLDVNYRKELPRLTKILDKLPFYSTTAPSSINVYAEGAYLDPGHAPQIGRGSGGTVFIDDFEGSKSGIDLRFPAISWTLASTPYKATTPDGASILFPEAEVNDNLDYGKNRAKIAWYQIEPALQQFRGPNNPLGENRAELSDPRTRLVRQSEIFPQRTTDFGQNQLVTFDLAFYPNEKGPYNFEDNPLQIDNSNRLRNPRARWGGLMRNIDQTDFETANIEFIEFWLQDPYVNTPQRPNASQTNGGKLYINLGNISEDVLKDGKRFYENGLPTPTSQLPTSNSVWGRVPLNPIQVANAFSNDPADRVFQDVGFDGINDEDERTLHTPYLVNLQNFLTPEAFNQVQTDPSLDNYRWYRDPTFTETDGIIQRYKNFNSPQGNSAISDGTAAFSSAATLYPDGEDLNRDNTMNETEEYFQYVVDIKSADDPIMNIGTNFIVDRKEVPITGLPDGTGRTETWYQFRVPIGSYNQRIGNIPDFKSIRFIRMFLTDFDSMVVMRFGKLELTRNIWRRYPYKVDTTGTYTPFTTDVTFDINGVNIEENDNRSPLPYRTPREIQRQQIQSNNGVNLLLNEQAMSLRFCDMGPGDARAVQQTFANRDLRQFGKLKMFVHAENFVKTPTSIKDGDLNAVIRIGTDFANNYYEVRIPLYLTPLSAASLNPNSDAYNDTLWLEKNGLDLDLAALPKLKADRNASGADISKIFRQLQANGHTYSVMGDPNLGEIKGILIAVENEKNPSACGEVWVNELRMTSMNEKGAFAAMARVDLTLADLGTITGSMSMHTTGFGTLEQRVNDRYRDNYTQFDIAANLELGKLLPKNAGISIPVFASYSQTVSKPEYDPFDMDIRLKDKINAADTERQKDSIKNAAIDFTSTTTVNFTNVRVNRNSQAPPKIYDISNIDVSYSYFNTKAHNPLIESNEVTRHRGGIGYNFAPQPKYIEPFKKMKFFKKPRKGWFDLVKDFNFNPVPSQLSFRMDVQRQFGAIRPRSIGSDKYKIPETYDKFFTMQRDYILRWNFTRSINFDFTASNNSRVDEPEGRLDTKEKRDTVWRRFVSGGRNTLYNHTANISYTLPTAKFPVTDWTTVNLKYQGIYRWIGASRLAIDLGNIIENGQTKEATAQFDFTRLYNKFKFFRAIDQPRVPNAPKAEVRTRTDTVWRYVMRDSVKVKEVKKLKIKKIKDPNAMPNPGIAMRVFGKLITSLKQANISISENANTRLPGYTDSTNYIGQNWNSMQPGLGFLMGKQPDTSWLNRAASNGVITKNPEFNTILQQSYNQRITATAQIEPVRDLNISVTLSKTFNKNYSELFKDTVGDGNNFGHLSPYTGGGFEISFISFQTLFQKFDPNQVSETFSKFQEYRQVISQRLGKLNPYSQTGPTPGDGYAFGYNRYATDVLIPAFVAAYTGKDPNTVALVEQSNRNVKSNPFSKFMPLPNWRLDYNGLSRIKGLDKIFSNITLSHGYTGSLGMNGFTSALLYQDIDRLGFPSFYDSSSNNYIPYFLIPNVTIQEQFAPLVGVDVMLTNQLQARVEYVKQRTLSLSLIDFQLSETRSTEFSIGAGYRKKGMKLFAGLPLPKFLSKSGSSKLDNEINFRLDFKVRDNVTINYRLDQAATLPTGGSKEVTITPSVDYFLNSRVNMKLFFDQRRVTPYISSSAPIVNTRAGVQVRISLAQ
ncbi:MAG TPA: cell surface protein SprA [Ferruginibacter sp.]|nr:cell surface protein SprA [Ferruginibacter sp.]HMP20778.1 cell surface protein SprA [Ferruginibacter sp.]